MRKKIKRYLKIVQGDIKMYDMKIILAKAEVKRFIFEQERLKKEQLEILKKEAKCLNV